MNDEAKLGLVAGVLAVVGVAVFGFPREPVAAAPVPAAMVAGTNAAPPALPPASMSAPGR